MKWPLVGLSQIPPHLLLSLILGLALPFLFILYDSTLLKNANLSMWFPSVPVLLKVLF